jgi:hypothetical protein
MTQLIFSTILIFTITACTFSPKVVDGKSQTQDINKNLICAKRVDILQVSINGANPPKEAFDLSMKKLKKYTTDNVVIHKTLNLKIKKDRINNFIQSFGKSRKGLNFLKVKEREKLLNALKKFPKNRSGIVMIYTPILLCSIGRESRGIAFNYSPDYNVVAYNQNTIDNAPVISKTQAWKIVLTHELGHRFEVPANKNHNSYSHCTSRECVLYAAPDWRAILSVLFHGMPYDFCDICKAELRDAKNSCQSAKKIPIEKPNRISYSLEIRERGDTVYIVSKQIKPLGGEKIKQGVW